MTNHWIDIKNSDCILIMGANPAENHPISFRFVMQAKDKGATLICVDPRFTRSAAVADIYARLRSGTDIAFLGGMIRYILENHRCQKAYVTHYTNAPFIVNAQFGFQDGLFTGFDPVTERYDTIQVGLRNRCRRAAPARPHPEPSALRVPTAENALCALRFTNGFQNYRNR